MTTTLVPDYDLNVAGARRLEDEITTINDDVVLDLAGVRFVASSGLRVLLKTAQRLLRDGHSFRVANPNDTVRSVFSMSGFDRIITIED